jgi:uncharacterized membrane protein
MPDAPSSTEQPENPQGVEPPVSQSISMKELVGFTLMVLLAVAISWASQAQLGWGKFLGPFHILLLHFPVVLLVLMAGLEVIWWRRGGEELRRIILWMMQLTVASTLLTVGLGVFLAREGGYNPEALDDHQNYGLAVMWTSVLAVALLTWANKLESHRLRQGYRLVLGATLVLMIMVGHSGGNLSHGDKFLIKHLPESIKGWLGKATTPTTNPKGVTPPKNGQDTQDEFTRVIWPILEERCIKCHGPKKQKGEYRVDKKETLFGGGESEEISIEPGDPAGSSLIRMILLHMDHDEVMPPEGKGEVTEEETWKLINWIKKGAPFSSFPVASATPGKE